VSFTIDRAETLLRQGTEQGTERAERIDLPPDAALGAGIGHLTLAKMALDGALGPDTPVAFVAQGDGKVIAGAMLRITPGTDDMTLETTEGDPIELAGAPAIDEVIYLLYSLAPGIYEEFRVTALRRPDTDACLPPLAALHDTDFAKRAANVFNVQWTGLEMRGNCKENWGHYCSGDGQKCNAFDAKCFT
jgi:hypothetical protein